VNKDNPQYWSLAEVKQQGDQPITSLPVACLFAPPQSSVPTALPLGQQAYDCTRVLVGINGLEGSATFLVNWLATDWLSNQSHWGELYDGITQSAGALRDRSVILMKPDGQLAGTSTLGGLLARFPPKPAAQ
jgi:hypothetical protein